MAENTYTANIENYRKTYWMSQYVTLESDSCAYSDLPAFFKIVTRAGKPRRQAATDVAAGPLADPWARVWNGVLTYLRKGRGRASGIESVPGHDNAFVASTNVPMNLSKEEPIHLDGKIISFAEPRGRITWSSGAQG